MLQQPWKAGAGTKSRAAAEYKASECGLDQKVSSIRGPRVPEVNSQGCGNLGRVARAKRGPKKGSRTYANPSGRTGLALEEG